VVQKRGSLTASFRRELAVSLRTNFSRLVGSFSRNPPFFPIVGRIKKQLPVLILEIGIKYISVEKRRGGINQHSGLQGINGFFGKRESIDCRTLGMSRNIRFSLVQQTNDLLKTGVHGLPRQLIILHLQIHGHVLWNQANGTVSTKQFKVDVGLQGLHVRLPPIFILLSHVVRFVDIINKNIGSSNQLIHFRPYIPVRILRHLLAVCHEEAGEQIDGSV